MLSIVEKHKHVLHELHTLIIDKKYEDALRCINENALRNDDLYKRLLVREQEIGK